MKNKYLRSDFLTASIFIFIGIVALILWCLDISTSKLLIGAIGFLPIGIGIMMLTLYQMKIAHSPELQKQQKLNDEERNIFIRTKAGNSAFWLTFAVTAVLFLAVFIINISVEVFSIMIFGFMIVAYLVLISIYSRKY